MKNYELNVVSNHPQFIEKTLKKYSVDGIDTVGVWGNEEFSIVFKNNTWSKVQIKLSLGGTDILTGSLADTKSNGKMWVVNPQGTLKLQAWPETHKGGAKFIFTDLENSVSAHTHGNLTSNDIIAAAVYTENYVYPKLSCCSCTNIFCNCGWHTGLSDLYDTTFIKYGTTVATNSTNYSASVSSDSKSLQSTASIGAGQYVNQNISNVAGLIEPRLSEILNIKYMWADDLASKLNSYNKLSYGFPGDEPIMSLGNTPRISDNKIQAPFSRIY